MNFEQEIPPEASGQRLDQFLKEALPEISRGRIQKAIRGGFCSLDNRVVKDNSCRLKSGQKIQFNLEEDQTGLKAEDGELKIVWHDANLAVCDKAPNLTVHPCPSCPENTLVQRLLSRFPQLASMGGDRPGIVHRLDKDTSGLILVALSEEARLKLTNAFSEREVGKEYLALVHGVPNETGESKLPIGRHPEIRTRMAVVPENRGGKNAHTTWKRLWSAPDNSFSLLAVRIHTGRTHQIRVHMAEAGYPLLGDRLYAPSQVRDMAPRQMLHAARLDLVHPLTAERLSFTSPLPQDFLDTILKNTEKSCNVVVTGNPGSGKSSFLERLAARGLPVISADAIIAKLYSQSRDVGDWLAIRGFTDAISPDRSINKNELMRIFEEKPELRQEFEKFVHELVRDEINSFWKQNQNQIAACAEVPLFFESGWHKNSGDVITVGIHCDQKSRFERLASNRNWPEEKIRAIESWQMPEEEKMARCDLVYNNMGSREEVARAADNLIEYINKKHGEDRQKLLAHIENLYRREIQESL